MIERATKKKRLEYLLGRPAGGRGGNAPLNRRAGNAAAELGAAIGSEKGKIPFSTSLNKLSERGRLYEIRL